MSSKCSRRSFLEGLSSLAIGTFGGGMLLSSRSQAKKSDHAGVPELPDGATILFQGDSITDAGRNKDMGDANNPGALGNGYAFLTAANLRKELYSKNLQCYNRGISGNKVFQLSDRWQEDCLDLEPDVLSILIGVNDYWHTRSGNYDGTPKVYFDDL
ncbi:MAG: GDSL-type esterase/lipase family protein [Balneolaceae bacterium]|nr:GDSL-type esterase/lipase family protein [Balneolaceae bacterium]